MSKSFRPWDVDQVWLLPASIHDFVPPEHPAHLVRDLVRSELDLAAIVSAYQEERGQPPYHPAMMAALPALADLFKQVLLLCRRAGLISFGHVALDGTKIKANASKQRR